jgi:DNA-3-methyladenine glycosylase II
MIVSVLSPFPWSALLGYLRGRLIPGSEQVVGETYVRIEKRECEPVQVTYDAKDSCLRVDVPRGVNALLVEKRVRHLFAPTHDAASLSALKQHPILQVRVASVPGFRPLGCWDPFELCVRTLIGQQVSVKAAQNITERIVQRCDLLRPANLAQANLDQIGMPTRRVAAIQGFAKAVDIGAVDLAADWSELLGQLAALPGFGPWTCSYLAIRLGRDPDAFPISDVGLIRATGAKHAKALEKIAESWRPLRAFAAAYLWMDTPGNSDGQQQREGA